MCQVKGKEIRVKLIEVRGQSYFHNINYTLDFCHMVFEVRVQSPPSPQAFNVWLKIADEKKEAVQVITQMLHNASLM